MKGVVHESGGGVYHVHLEDGAWVEASLRGRLKRGGRRGDRVVVGDRVAVERAGEAWTIESVLARSTELVRRARAGRAPKVLVANLDRVLAVVAGDRPRATFELVDRLLALGESSGMQPVIVVNKLDLPGAREVADDFSALYAGIGYDLLAVSAQSGVGMDGFQRLVCSGTSTLIGPSGVGKSSLLNAVDPALDLRTRELSRKTGTGRHTTVGSRLIPLTCGGLVADTPGFGDVSLFGVEPDAIAGCFRELAEPARECRFRRCTHLHEPDCGVRGAVDEGRVAASRYRSYQTLFAEAVAASEA